LQSDQIIGKEKISVENLSGYITQESGAWYVFFFFFSPPIGALNS